MRRCIPALAGAGLAALNVDQIDSRTRTVTVDRKVIEIGGRQYIELPKGRKRRRTIYPSSTRLAIPSPRPSRLRSVIPLMNNSWFGPREACR